MTAAPPVPTVARAGVSECGATVTGDSLTVLSDVLAQQEALRDRLEATRTERFCDGGSPFDVGLESNDGAEDCPIPAAAADWLQCVSDDRWHEIHRSMLLAGYPPGAADGRCDRAEATDVIVPGESAGARTLRCGVDRVNPLPDAPDGCLRVSLGGGDRTIDVTLDAPRDINGLLEQSDQVSLTRHSAAALATVRSLGGALADTPSISISFEQIRTCREYGTIDQGVGSLVDARLVDRLDAAPAFPEPPTPDLLARALAEGPFTTEERIEIARLTAGQADRIRLRYGESVPRLIAAVADVLECALAHVPQTGDVVLCADSVPSAIDQFSSAFPDSQRLSPSDRATLAATLETPDLAVPEPRMIDRYRATEVAARLAAAEDLSPEAAFYLQVSPWVPEPTPAAIRADVDRGRALVADLRAWAEAIEPRLVGPPLETCWELAAGADAGPPPGVE